MSNSALRVLAGSGAKGDPVYVDDVFSTFVYTGNGSSQNITSGMDLSGEGGLVWTKARDNTSSGATDHALIDTVRGTSKWLRSNDNYGQYTHTTLITSFNSDGHTVGSAYWTNDNGYRYVAWTFRKAEKFFDIVSYTGTGGSQNISHNLGSTPGMIIIKQTGDQRNWIVWHRSLSSVSGGGSGGSQSTLVLNNSDPISGTGYIQSPTSTQFTVDGSNEVSKSSQNYIAYVFGHNEASYGEDSDEVIIKCDKYSGDGGSSNFVDVGFEPQFVFIKKATSGGGNDGWRIFDSMRGVPTGANAEMLVPNESNPESDGTSSTIDFNATGFTLTSNTGGLNQSSAEYIYMAIRRPHKPASEFAATDLFKVEDPSGSVPTFNAGFPVDFILNGYSTGTAGNVYTRLTGNTAQLQTHSTSAETSAGGTAITFDQQLGIGEWTGGAGSTYLSWMWRRAPGYFDVVIYTGTGSARTVTHNLGVAPEMIWVKRRAGVDQWYVYAAPNGNDKKQELNADSQAYSDSMWNNTTPSASTFSVDSTAGVNSNGQSIIAFLFASVDGISKVGSYTGTGSNLNVDCGFSAGARFVLIKRTDGSGGWYYWDYHRGIVAGDDPYALLNSSAASVTNTDYIDPLSSGFTVTSSAPSQLNNSGGTYLFYAIA